MKKRLQTLLGKRLLDYLLGAWAAIVIFRFCAPYLGMQALALTIEISGLHVLVISGCLALAAIGATLDAVGSKRNN